MEYPKRINNAARKELVGDKEKDKKTSDRVDTPKNVHPRRSVGR